MALFRFPNAKAWTSGRFPAPWDPERPAIFTHVRDNGPEADLPDEAAANAGNRIRFAPGALDNLMGGGDGDAGGVVRLIGKVMDDPGKRQISALYDALRTEGAIGMVDAAISLLRRDTPDPNRFAMFFDWLARNAPDREPVKFAVAMLGMLDGDRFREVFLTLGAHEEFTKYAAVALGNALPGDEGRKALVELAGRVDGWGRIDLVERLAPEGDAGFRHWLVREGYRNSVMYEYLAWTAAHHGRLLEQLEADDVDDDLLDGAADIFGALVQGGPAEDITVYDDAVPAAKRWLSLMADRPASLRRAMGARMLHLHATGDGHGWSDGDAGAIGSAARAYLDRPGIAEAVTAALTSGEGPAFWSAKTVAPVIGIDPWPLIFDLQVADQRKELWYDLMRTDDPERIDRVVALALERLPLDAIATGPGEEMGLGPGWASHGALDYILQDLAKHPGKGWPLIRTGLQSPVTRNRNMALKALAAWAREDWPDGAMHLLREAARHEPNGKVKDRIEDLLRPRDASAP